MHRVGVQGPEVPFPGNLCTDTCPHHKGLECRGVWAPTEKGLARVPVSCWPSPASRAGWGLPGGAQSMAVSFSDTGDLSFTEDTLVKLRWLGKDPWPVSSLSALARREKRVTLNFLKS